MPDSPSPPSTFLAVTCQVGAERAVKGEVARHWPEFRFAYSRPGFMTFKLPAAPALAEDLELRSVFARAYFFSLGRVSGASEQELAGEVWKLAGRRRFERLHVWPRDVSRPGRRGYEPGQTPESQAARAALLHAAAGRPELPEDFAQRPAIARSGELVLDCVLVEPNEWWVGWHHARTVTSRWPGGQFEQKLPPQAVSRAYLKMQEALAWSRLPVRPGQKFVELGCAPGGSSQALLERGLQVVGVDPGVVDPRVTEHPGFTHFHKRAADVRRIEFRRTHWLAADMNVAPQYTLDCVEAIITHEHINVWGLLLTLKLLDWELAREVDTWLARVRSWGYADVRARQLHHNRQEICLAALRARALRRRKG